MSNKKSLMEDFRGDFQRYILSDLFLNNIGVLFHSINEGDENELLYHLWKDMIIDCGYVPEDYPTNITAEIFEDNKNKNRYYMIISMPDLPYSKGSNLAIYFMVSFGSTDTDDVRYFLCETDSNSIYLPHIYVNQNNKSLFVAEIKNATKENIEKASRDKRLCYFSEPDYGLHLNYGPIHIPYNEKNQYDECVLFADRVIEICNEKKGIFHKLFKR